VKDPRQPESYRLIEADLKAYCAAHPDYDALDLRQACYRSMQRHFVPFLFRESPFYFEAGVNGGWGGKRPARLVNRLCRKFYKTQNLIPDSAFELLGARSRQRLALCCGPFSDDMHHVPPFRVVLEKGFGGIRAEVAAALEKCPKDDPLGRGAFGRSGSSRAPSGPDRARLRIFGAIRAALEAMAGRGHRPPSPEIESG